MPVVLAVLSTSGGLGASCLAAALAVRAADAGRSAVVVDLDRVGGRLDVVLGVEQEPGWRWPQLATVRGVVDGAGLAARLPATRGVSVLGGASGWPEDAPDGPDGGVPGGRAAPHPSGPGVPGTAGPHDVVDWLVVLPDVVAGLGVSHDVTVLDVPRDAAVLAAVAPLVDACVVLVGTEVVQLAAAAVALPAFRRVLTASRADADDWSGPEPRPVEPWAVLRGSRVEPELEDLVMDELGVPVVAVLGDERRLADELAGGRPPGSRGRGDLVHVADEVLVRCVALVSGAA